MCIGYYKAKRVNFIIVFRLFAIKSIDQINSKIVSIKIE